MTLQTYYTTKAIQGTRKAVQQWLRYHKRDIIEQGEICRISRGVCRVVVMVKN